MIDAEPPRSLRLFRVACELCDRGDVEAGCVLLRSARDLAAETEAEAFSHSLIAQIDQRLALVVQTDR